MTYVPYKKGTLLIPTGGKNHLFAIITEKCPQGEHLIVNVTSVNAGISHDTTCILDIGDHPFIRRQSYVEYRRADIVSAAHMTKMVDSRVYQTSADISANVLQLLCDGIEDSPFVKRRILNYFKSQP
jgi:hypothetical protein